MRGLGISCSFALQKLSNKKRKSNKRKELATMSEKVGVEVKKEKFNALVTLTHTPST